MTNNPIFKQKLLNILGLSKKAGKIVYGFDSIEKAIFRQEIDCVFLAKDISEKTKKNVEFFCSKSNIKINYCNFTMDEIDYMIGKKTGIIAINDAGLSQKAKELHEADKQETI